MATARDLRRFRPLVFFLIAFWIYNDGISTIIKMAGAYAVELKIPQDAILKAFIITQFVGIPCAIAYGYLAKKIGSKRAVFLGLAVYVGICIFGYFMRTATHFYMLAITVGFVQGGTQALSRSLFASMVPKAKATEFFGFFSTGSKVAGLIGPAIFGIIAQVANDSRPAIVSIAAFFVIGAILLSRVDEKSAIATAAEIDAKAIRGEEGPAPVATS